MNDWSHGYVTDIEYTAEFYPALAPAHLDLACLMNGVEPPNRIGKAAYCELGCGQGVTTAALAAANPDVAFWGIDFNPAHMARAQALQAGTGLGNLYFFERSFADLAGGGAADLPPFDYITMHGVYTWIGEEDRRAVLRFLAERLKPGGLVYVGYNCMPGRANQLPLQRLLSEHARHSRLRSDQAIARATAFARRLREAGAYAISERALASVEELLAAGRHAYLAHEYLGRDWPAMYHCDVAAQLAGAKLDYVASAAIIETIRELLLTPAQRQACEELAAPHLSETLKDYFVPAGFRQDVYVKGVRRLTAAQRDARLRRLRLALAVPRERLKYEFDVPVGQSKVNERLYRPIFEALARQPMTIAELLDVPAVKQLPGASPGELIGVLVGTLQTVPLPHSPDDAARHTVLAFNRVVAEDALDHRRTAFLAAAAAGSALQTSPIELCAYLAMIGGTPATMESLQAALAQATAQRGLTLQKEGKPITDASEKQAALRQEIGAILGDKLPIWRNLGVV